MEEIRLKEVDFKNGDLLNLINKLDIELLTRYPAHGIHGLDFSDKEIDKVLFVVAYCIETPVGCGALRPISDNSIELKRFFVDRSYRKLGIASKILKYLENKAKEVGYSLIRLETGPEQPESINLYKKFGYYEIDKFGEYVDDKYSICFEKKLVSE